MVQKRICGSWKWSCTMHKSLCNITTLPYVRVNPPAHSAVQEDAQGAHEVPGK